MNLVEIVDRDRMNLLGLILASLLERNLVSPQRRKLLDKTTGIVVVRAGEMQVTATFAEGRVSLTRGYHENANATLTGPLDALTHLALGQGLVKQFFRLDLGGNLFLLLKVWRLMLVSPLPPAPSPETGEGE